jgi:hypothetical protein
MGAETFPDIACHALLAVSFSYEAALAHEPDEFFG